MAAPRLSTLLGAGLAATTVLLPAGVLADGDLRLTEAELRAYDGTDTSKPIYIAIDGTIFDVSVAPSFYGPGGHYNHFAGRDATRAWVTECWDTPDQLTWRMDGIEVMFTPKWLDEMIEDAGKGDESVMGGAVGAIGLDTVAKLAEKAAAKFGTVSEKDKKKRREEDAVAGAEGVKKALDHWYKFFSENPKYTAVGKVILDEENTPEPPPPCENAMKKRPMKGGLLDSLGMGGGIMGMGGAGKGAQDAKAGGKGKVKGDESMPDFMKKLDEMKKKSEEREREAGDAAAPADDDDDEDLVKDEL